MEAQGKPLEYGEETNIRFLLLLPTQLVKYLKTLLVFNTRQSLCNRDIRQLSHTVKYREGPRGREGGRWPGPRSFTFNELGHFVVSASRVSGFTDHIMFRRRLFTVLCKDRVCLWNLMWRGGPVAISWQRPKKSEVFFFFMKCHFLSINAKFRDLLAFSW